jgi:phage FluMu protein Com
MRRLKLREIACGNCGTMNNILGYRETAVRNIRCSECNEWIEIEG